MLKPTCSLFSSVMRFSHWLFQYQFSFLANSIELHDICSISFDKRLTTHGLPSVCFRSHPFNHFNFLKRSSAKWFGHYEIDVASTWNMISQWLWISYASLTHTGRRQRLFDPYCVFVSNVKHSTRLPKCIIDDICIDYKYAFDGET